MTASAGPASRPGSRLDRLSRPLARQVLRNMAEHAGVCVRPIVLRRTDQDTGATEVVEIPCGARLAVKCKPCAERTRRLRIQQIREGWHLAEEPVAVTGRAGLPIRQLVTERADLEFQRRRAEVLGDWDQVAALDARIDACDAKLAAAPLRGRLTPATERKSKARRRRSTRRRSDAPDLPRLPVKPRTVGRVYRDADGRTRRPSSLLTVTLPSYGPVHSSARRGTYLVPCECGRRHGERDPLIGTPLDPDTYDYRRAALDAIHFAAALDRFWQNARRAAGWKVQYAGAVELQRRLAPHGHFAVRGTLPRALWRKVAAATYHQVWWPQFAESRYRVDNPPVWDLDKQVYVDPKTREPLPPWEHALGVVDTDPNGTPAHVVRLGRIDVRGIDPGHKDTERSIRYVTKYVTKDIADTARTSSDPQRAHFDRMHAELATLPCSPACANWLLYGVQPKQPTPKMGLVPGRCRGKVHQPDTLCFTGRRVLVSRAWSSKTLADLRADNAGWVRAILAHGTNGNDDQADKHDQPEKHDKGHEQKDGQDQVDGKPRYLYQVARPDDPDVRPYQHRILAAIAARQRFRTALLAARHRNQELSATSN